MPLEEKLTPALGAVMVSDTVAWTSTGAIRSSGSTSTRRA